MIGTLEHLGWPLPAEPVRDLIGLRAWQAGRCAMCRYHDRRPNWTLDLDHDHHTGLVRGYLCRVCNQAEVRGWGPEWVEWRDGATPASRLGLVLQYSHNDAAKAVFRSYVPDDFMLRLVADAAVAPIDPGDPGWDEWCADGRAQVAAHAAELAKLIYDPR